jgi:hypothetical protein
MVTSKLFTLSSYYQLNSIFALNIVFMINTIFDFWIVFTVICSIIAGILLIILIGTIICWLHDNDTY